MIRWVLRSLNNVHRKFDYVVKFTKVGQTRLLMVRLPETLCASVNSAHVTEKDNARSLDDCLTFRRVKTMMYLKYHFFGSKFTKMSISQLWTNRQDLVPYVRKCRRKCWDTCKVLHYAQLKFDFFLQVRTLFGQNCG